jgi:lysophospholipase L1-like esterase
MIRFSVLICWFCLSVPAAGQWIDLALQREYPFLNQEVNKLQFKGDSDAFMAFYQKLDTLIFKGKGQINIVHFGGSHVQAGTLSERMRQNWLHLSPDLKHSRGFFFPYKLAQTNNPVDYLVQYDGYWEGCRCALPAANCSWGVSGINASTVDTNAAFTITALDNDTGVYPFSAVRIFYLLDDTSFTLKPVCDVPIKHTRYDSVANFVEFQFAAPCTTLTCTLVADSTKTGFTLQGIQYISDKPGLTYHAIGVNGAATYSFLRCSHFAQQLQSLKPDLVIFGLGINDAHRPENEFKKETYEANYDSLVQLIQGVNPNAVFIFMTNNDSYYKRRYSNPNIVKVQAAMASLSAKYESAYWDLFDVMGGFNSIRIWEEYGLAKKDKIHFTPEGYRLQADLLFDAIKRSYGAYLQHQNKKQH